jgi:WD40 repeat protein
MRIVRWVTLLIPLLLISACSSVIHKDFLQNFTKDSQETDGSFSSRVVTLKYNDKEKYLVVGHESGSIDIWDAKKARSKREIKAHEYRANQLAFSSDGNAFFSNSYFERSTKLWDARTGELLHSIPDMRGPVGATPNEQIYVIANSQHVRLFDYKRKLLLSEEYVCGGVVTALATDASSGQIAVGTASGTVEVWQFLENEGIPSLKMVSSANPYPIGDWVVGLQFSSSGNSLYSVARFGSIDEWVSKNRAMSRRSVPTILKHVHSAAFFGKKKELLALAGTEEKVGLGPGLVEVISLVTHESKTYRVNTNLAVVEFLPPLSSLIAAQSRSTKVYTLPNEN